MSRPSLPFRRARCLLRQSQGDPDAFGEFYDAYARRLLIFFTRRVIDAELALDLTSETFAKALEKRQQFRGRTTEEEAGWLFAIARSELSHYWRRGAVEKAALARIGVPVPELSNAETDRIEQLAGLAEVRPQLVAGLRELSDDQRQVMQLRIIEEMEYPEIARELGVSEDVVRARVSRALRSLREHVTEMDPLNIEEAG